MFSHSGHQVASKCDQIIRLKPLLDQLVGNRRVVARIQIVLIENLKRNFAGSATAGHEKLGWIMVDG
jgi:hypothetical protein